VAVTDSESDFDRGVAAFILGAIAASLVATFFEIFPMDALTWLLLGVVAAGPLPLSGPSVIASRVRHLGPGEGRG
jgi:hypothetical protein